MLLNISKLQFLICKIGDDDDDYRVVLRIKFVNYIDVTKDIHSCLLFIWSWGIQKYQILSLTSSCSEFTEEKR